MTRILIIGIDGATWDVIKPWTEEDKLPTFKKLMEKGVFGILESTIPPLSPPGWTSAFTGVNPGKHNLFDFFIYDNYEKHVVTSKTRKAKAIWQILNEYGKKVVVVNVPLTYPPDKVDGVMISGMGTPGLKSDFTYPKSFKKELLENIGYRMEIGRETCNEDTYLKNLYNTEEKIKEMAIYLMNHYRWDMFITVFVCSDRVQHFYWKYMDTKHPMYNPEGAKKYGDAILKYYQKLDNILKKLIENIDESTIVIIMSDHGFGPIYKGVYIGNWLREHGFLKLKEGRTQHMFINIKKLMFKFRLTKEKFVSLLLFKLHLEKFTEFIPKQIKKMMLDILPSSRNPFSNIVSEIDWYKTKAYSPSSSGQSIMINVKGRELNGIVEPHKEYEEVRNYIIKELSNLEDPEINKKIIKKVYKREEIYWGPYVGNAPDLIVEMRDGYFLHEGFGEKLIMSPKFGPGDISASHRLEGIFLTYSPAIKKGKQIIKNAKIIDIAPTILHLFGIPIPRDMDGRVLKEIFKEDREYAKKDIAYQEVEDKSEKDRIRNKIKDLKSISTI